MGEVIATVIGDRQAQQHPRRVRSCSETAPRPPGLSRGPWPHGYQRSGCVYNARDVMIGSGNLGRVREQRPLSPRRSVIKPAGSVKTAGDRSAYLTGGRDMGDQWGDRCKGTEEEEMELEERWRCEVEVVIRRMAAFFFRPITCLQFLHQHHRSVYGVQKIIVIDRALVCFCLSSNLLFTPSAPTLSQ